MGTSNFQPGSAMVAVCCKILTKRAEAAAAASTNIIVAAREKRIRVIRGMRVLARRAVLRPNDWLAIIPSP